MLLYKELRLDKHQQACQSNVKTNIKVYLKPVCPFRLLQSRIEEKSSSKASAELKCVISTRGNAKAHLFNMLSDLTAIKHQINLEMHTTCQEKKAQELLITNLLDV